MQIEAVSSVQNDQSRSVSKYINISSAAINSNKTRGFFDINAPQYTSHYKTNRALSFLPVHAHFNSNKYKTKKPIPSNNMYVSFEGFLETIETDTTGHATSFHMSVDNINFLGTGHTFALGHRNFRYLFTFSLLSYTEHIVLASNTPSPSSRFKYNFNAAPPGSSTGASVPEAPSAVPHSDIGVLTRGSKWN